MILVDTAVWIAHIRQPVTPLVDLLDQGQIGIHPFIIGELSLGNLKPGVLTELRRLPYAISASHREAMLLIEQASLAGSGIGYVDAHLLTSARLTPDALIWTRDRHFRAVAGRLRLDAEID